VQLSAAREKVALRYDGSYLQRVWKRLGALDFVNQAVLFGSGVLLSLLPFLILLSAFADQRIDDDVALHLGLDHRAATIVSHLFNQHGTEFSSATFLSLLFMVVGTLTVVAALQEIYEKVFEQPRRGLRDLPRYVVWFVAMCAVFGVTSSVGNGLHGLPAGALMLELLALAVFTPFVWWTMHFLLAGRVPWRRLWPSAVATGICAAGLGIFSSLYFSSSIIFDDRVYGPIGAVFDIATWLVAIGAMIILGAVAGVAWQDRASDPVAGVTTD